MYCKLCQNNKKLMNSHIIPEFIYKPLYDDKHRFHVLSTYSAKGKPMEQKGIREKLLCTDCEQHLSKYEGYARKVLFGGVNIVVQNDNGGIVVSEIDYKYFKLFQLSILWRASVSSHKMFKNVNLGKHQHMIRQMILSDIPGHQEEYCCVMMAIKSGSDGMGTFIDQPEKGRIDNHVVYRFIFGSIVWIYFVSSHKIPKLINDFLLTEKGNIRLAVKDISELDCVKGFAQDLHHMGRFSNDIA